MITRTHLLHVPLFAAAFATAAAMAFQGGIAAVGWTDARFSEMAENYFSSRSDGLPGAGYFSEAVRKQWLTKGAAERATAIRELSLYAKRFVTSPTFEKTYDGWIRGHLNAIDHGLKPTAVAPEQQLSQMQASIGASMAAAYAQMDPTILKMLFDQDLQNWKVSDGVNEKKWLARAVQIEPLLKSNPGEFKKQYGLLKSATMGGPSTEAGLVQATSKTAELVVENQKREQQENYDKYRLKLVLKDRLASFVKIARSVDFAAPTKSANGREVFVNPAFEQQGDTWKKLYRLGKEPTLAALAVAEQWLKEL